MSVQEPLGTYVLKDRPTQGPIWIWSIFCEYSLQGGDASELKWALRYNLNCARTLVKCLPSHDQTYECGGRHSSVYSSAPTILRSQVQIPSTPSVFSPFIVKMCAIFVSVEKGQKKRPRLAHSFFLKKNTNESQILILIPWCHLHGNIQAMPDAMRGYDTCVNNNLGSMGSGCVSVGRLVTWDAVRIQSSEKFILNLFSVNCRKDENKRKKMPRMTHL